MIIWCFNLFDSSYFLFRK